MKIACLLDAVSQSSGSLVIKANDVSCCLDGQQITLTDSDLSMMIDSEEADFRGMRRSIDFFDEQLTRDNQRY
jgi:hypothetical protein